MRATIDDLDPEQQAQLVALMWLGRGDYELDEWDTAVEDARDALGENLTEYLLSHPMVADDLEEGMIQFGYSCED